MRIAVAFALCLGCGGAPAAEPADPSAEPEPRQAEVAAPAETRAPVERAADSPRDRAGSAMEALFAACRDGRLPDAAELIAYRGPDEARRWRSTPRMDAPEEARQVEGVCARVAGALAASTGYQKVGYQSEAQSEGVWHVWEVRFDTASGPRTQLFAFLEVDGRFLLGDID